MWLCPLDIPMIPVLSIYFRIMHYPDLFLFFYQFIMLFLFIVSVYLLNLTYVTFEVRGDSIITSTPETGMVEETVQSVGEWSTDELAWNSRE